MHGITVEEVTIGVRKEKQLKVSTDEKVCEETLGAPCLVFWNLDKMVRDNAG